MPKEQPRGISSYHVIAAGLTTGAAHAVLFHVPDKAMYTAQVRHRSFFNKANFEHPFHGFYQSVLQRTFQSGSYYCFQSLLYPLKTFFREQLTLSDRHTNFLYGGSVGVFNAIFNHPLTVIRYKTWGNKRARFLSTAMDLWRENGVKGYTQGSGAMIGRDICFATTYEVVRRELRSKSDSRLGDFAADTIAGGVAVKLSSPLNYARNYIFHNTSKTHQPGIHCALRELHGRVIKPEISVKERFFLTARALQLGPATIRLALGMGVGQYLYDNSLKIFKDIEQEFSKIT